jgi:signal transduction histidine kinase
LNQIFVAPKLCEIAAAFVRASDEHLAMHLGGVEAIGTDCKPIVNVVEIRAATANARWSAPVADEFCRQAVVARVGALRQSGKKRCGRLKQILLNLLSNACKFSKQGEVTLRIRKVTDGRD